MSGRVALVSGHFPPSNLVGAQRARLWSRYLPEFGWEPIVVTGDPEAYEEKPDPDLVHLVAPGLRVIHAATLSTRPVRIVGDIGLRAFYGCYKALAKLAANREIDFVLVTIPSNYLALVGGLIHRRYGVPFGIDYQDPWVTVGADRPFTKAWGSRRLARLLEPKAVRGAALITGMAPGYVAGMLQRNPAVVNSAVVAYMPMGMAPEDFELVRSLHRKPFLFDPGDGQFHMIYAGALLPAGVAVLDAFLAGLRALRDSAPSIAARLRAHFVGTGTSSDAPQGYRVLPRAQSAGVAEVVEEHRHRIGYVGVPNALVPRYAVLVIGSTERHYTPSKVFQGMLSRRPVFALLHEESSAVGMIRTAGAGEVLTLTERVMPGAEAVAASLQRIFERPGVSAATVDMAPFESYSARESTRALARALDEARERLTERRPTT